MANDTKYGYLISPAPQFLDTNGKPISGGKLKVYIAGTTTKATTYSDWNLTKNTWPIVLDAMGTCQVIVSSANLYKFVLESAEGEEPLVTRDNVAVAYANVDITGIGSEVVNSDGSVDVTATTDPDTGRTTYDVSVKDTVQDIEGLIEDEAERATAAEKAAKTEVVAGDNITVTKTVGADGQDVYTIDGENGGVDGVFGVYARNGDAWSRTKGDADITNLTAGNYHYTLFIGYSVSTPSNVIAEIESNAGTQTHKTPVDCSYAHDGWVEFSGDYYGASLNPTLVFPTGVSLYPAAILFVHSTAGGGSGGGSGDNDKVAVDAGAVAGFLKDVLVSASDMVTLVQSGNKLMVNVNLDYSSDPKLATMNESQVDGATSNYGGYQLKAGADKLEWGDDSYQTFDWLNAQVYQCMRLSDAQGTITKCNVALCGSLGFQSPAPCFNAGIFDALTGECLGQSGLKFYGEDFGSDEEPCEVDMVETSEGSLTIKRNQRYIIQVWTCGLQLAGLDRSTDYNYTYDYTLRQNLQTTTSLPKFVDVTSAMNRASAIPMVSFGAESLF